MRAYILLLFCLLPLSVPAQERAVDKISTMTVRGEATTKVSPDQVTLPVTVREENPILKTAKKKHDDKLRALLKLAEDAGIAKDKTQTSYTAVNPLYDYDRDNSHPHLRGYQVVTSVDFTLTDMAKLADFMNNVIDAGISDLGSVNYSLQDESKIKEDTLVKALTQAHEKASRLAGVASVALGGPLDIQEGDVEINRPMPPRPMVRMAAMAMPAAAPPDLPSGLIEIHQTVTVTYQLK